MTVSVRVLEQSDRKQWEKLYYGYAEFYKVPMNQEILDNVWGWIFDENKSFYSLIAINTSNEDTAVGFMHFRAMPSPLRGKEVGFLDDLFISSEARGMGVVDLLYQELEKQAKSHGWPFVRWITAENNYRGRGVYDRISTKTSWTTYQMDV